jgi:hypothetical protein
MSESEADTIAPVQTAKEPHHAADVPPTGEKVYAGQSRTEGADGFLSGGGVPQRNFVLLSLSEWSSVYWLEFKSSWPVGMAYAVLNS